MVGRVGVAMSDHDHVSQSPSKKPKNQREAGRMLSPLCKKKSVSVWDSCRNLVVLPKHCYHLKYYICACTMD